MCRKGWEGCVGVGGGFGGGRVICRYGGRGGVRGRGMLLARRTGSDSREKDYVVMSGLITFDL